MRGLRCWIAPGLLGAVAVLGSFGPVDDDAHAVWLQRFLGLDAVPTTAQALVCATLGLAAVVLALRGPRVLWPLLTIAVAAWLLRGAGPLVFVACFCVAGRLRRIRPLLGLASVAALTLVAPEAVVAAGGAGWEGFAERALADVGVSVVLPIVLCQWLEGRRREVVDLHARAWQHAREREIRATQARAEERARIAREMHDVLAHRVSLMVLYAGAVEVNTAEPEVVDRAALIRDNGRQALEQLREVLGVLRDPRDPDSAATDNAPPPGRAELPALLAASRSAGAHVDFVEDGGSVELPAACGHAVYRVVREALTNAHKHADGAPIEVRLCHRRGGVEVCVRNAPAQPADPLPGSGAGLLGLRERVELLDGTFCAGPDPDGGFTVRAQLPTLAGKARGPVEPAATAR